MDPPSNEAAEQPSSSLPNDLIEDILARMPAKSVMRSSQGFVDRHLRLANRCHSPRLFILPEFNSSDTTVHAWSPGRPLAAVTGQCRGLVVLEADRPTTIIRNLDDPNDRVYFYKVNHYVWNPSTGQIMALPKGNDSFGCWPHHHDNLGIGYDTRIRKHKVVCLYCRGDLPPACEVYVLNSTGQWRPLSIFAQGHLHWVAEPDKKFNFGRIIMSFSISDEEFGIIVELNGHLCVFNNSGEFERSFDIWVLCDHQAGAWDLYCRIDLDTPPLSDTQLMRSCSIIPIGCVDDGSRLLLRPDPHWNNTNNWKSHQLFMYRPADGDVEDLLTGGGIITHHTVARRVVAPYEESLESTGP
ncbi:hypothetical protein VPH35_070881 [Triticum aestivum]